MNSLTTFIITTFHYRGLLSRLLLVALILMQFGCATTSIVDYDGENISEEEKQRLMDDGGVIYTNSVVILKEFDDVSIIIRKADPIITFHKDYEVKQDRWNVTAHNLDDEDVCVTLVWKLMDFRFVSEYPSEFFLPGEAILSVGEMIQQVWEIQGVQFTPDGSGYLHDMLVREPVEDALKGDECTFIEKEENIIER